MKTRLNRNVFIRHAGEESLLWRPRTGASFVLKDAMPLLEEIGREWRSEWDIIDAYAAKVDCQSNEVAEVTFDIFEALQAEGLIQCEGFRERGNGFMPVTTTPAKQIEDDDAVSPVEEFCRRHHVVSELHIDLTDGCTERCVHCYVPRKEVHQLPYADIEKVLRDFRDLQGLTVHITGGECMMHPDFVRICRLCKQLELNIIIFSNLTLCDARMVDALREIDPQFINVSLYAMNAGAHDAITRLPGSWKKTMDAIDRCQRAGVHIRLAAPVLKANQGEFAALHQFAKSHRVHLIPSCDIVPMADHCCSNLDHVCSACELRAVLSANKGLFDRGWNGQMPDVDAKVCDIGATRLYLNAKGEYYPCDSMHGYVLGTVRENTLEEVWHGEKLNYLRSLKNKDFGKCASCEHRPWCKVCPAFNFNATEDLFKTIPAKCAVSGVIHEVYGGKCDVA